MTVEALAALVVFLILLGIVQQVFGDDAGDWARGEYRRWKEQYDKHRAEAQTRSRDA